MQLRYLLDNKKELFMTEKEFKERIDAIKRLKLITNNSEEWNHKYRKNNDQNELLYKSLYYDVYTKYDICLDDLMRYYLESDSKTNGVFYKNKRKKACQKENNKIVEFVKACISDCYNPEDYNKTDRNVLDEFYKYSIDNLFLALILLWSKEQIGRAHV